MAERRTEGLPTSQFPAGRNKEKLPLAAKSFACFDEAQGKLVVLEEPVALRIGSSSADIRLEHKIAVIAAKMGARDGDCPTG